ncbi:ATP-binding cassette domain-containing protein [Shigella flexneri]
MVNSGWHHVEWLALIADLAEVPMFTATEAVPVAKVVAGKKRYPGVVALDNVNFTLNKGEVRALLGKNGAGKSTSHPMLTGSERPDSGDIWIGETRLGRSTKPR